MAREEGVPTPDPTAPPRPPAQAPPQPPIPSPGGTTPPLDPWAQMYQQYGFSPTGLSSISGLDPSTQASIGDIGGNIQDQMMQAYSQDIPYFRSPDLAQTNEGQAILASISEPINTQYDTARENLLNSPLAVNQGMSGPIMDELTKLEEDRARALSDVSRQFLTQHSQNLLQSEQQLGNVYNLQNQAQAQGLAYAQQLNDQQRQAILDLYPILGLGQATQTAADQNAANLFQYATNLGAQTRYGQQQAYGGLGNMAYLYGLMNPNRNTATNPGLSGFYSDPAQMQAQYGTDLFNSPAYTQLSPDTNTGSPWG